MTNFGEKHKLRKSGWLCNIRQYLAANNKADACLSDHIELTKANYSYRQDTEMILEMCFHKNTTACTSPKSLMLSTFKLPSAINYKKNYALLNKSITMIILWLDFVKWLIFSSLKCD